MAQPIGETLSKTLEFVRRFTEEQGKPPTIKEIAVQFDISAPSAYDHIRRLEEAGYIKRTPKQWRSIQIIEAGESAAAVPIREMVQVPIVGKVAAGQPILAQENREGHLPIDPIFLRSRGTLFALKIKGDSMEGAGIREGDYLIVRQQPVADNGDIVVALMGNEGTVKRLKMCEHKIELVPENPRYKPIRVENGDEFRVVGKALAVYRIAKTLSPKNAAPTRERQLS